MNHQEMQKKILEKVQLRRVSVMRGCRKRIRNQRKLQETLKNQTLESENPTEKQKK